MFMILEIFIRCELIFKLSERPKGIIFSIALQNKYKNRIFSSDHPIEEFTSAGNIEHKIIFEFPKLPYAPGHYSLIFGLHIPNIAMFDLNDDKLPFESR